MRKIHRWLGIALLCVFWVAAPQVTFADYGGPTTYGTCAYGSACASGDGGSSSSSATSGDSGGDAETVVTLPSSGLEVSINLHDGQLIPKSGYLIIVTPLNGRGTSFKTASFSINNSTPATATPDETGTAQWRWLPQQLPGTHITVVVSGQDGQTVTKNFTVRVVSSAAAAVGSIAPVASGGLSGGIRRLFQALPRQAVDAFPYILFIILAANIALLLLQTSREVVELRAVRRRLKRLQLMGDMKRTFTELVSHYLRTPLTLVSGGLEEMGVDGARLSSLAARLQTSVTALVGEARSAPQIAQASVPVRPFAAMALWLPLGAASVLTALFDYLAQDVGGLSFSRAALFVQIASFVLLAVSSYIVARLVQLRRRDTRETHRLVELAEKQLAVQEDFVAETFAMLRADFKRLAAGIGQTSPSQSKVFVQDGVMRLGHMLDKFAIALQLRGAKSDAPFTPLRANELITNAWRPLAEEAEAKGVRLATPKRDIVFAGQSATLLTLVCNHVLDNAVAYAAPGSEVTVTATNDDGRFSLCITDRGLGIPADKLAWLLEPFAKSEGAETFNHEGMGFSLYLDRLILTYFGGALTIASTPRAGTAVTLRLPQPSSPNAQELRGTETFQMPWPSAAKTAHAAPMVASDDVNS
ncbi:MAG TPA: ATP-binding protein [Candidatus Saccharimonadales bacterium]